MKPITLALAALLLSSAAAAQTGTGSNLSSSASAPEANAASQAREAGQPEAGADRQERRVCRRIDSTGTRNARPVCMTVRQWREYNQR